MASTQTDFWERMGFQEEDRVICLTAVQEKYDGYSIEEFEYQGYCSFTILLSPREEHITSENGIQSSSHTNILGVARQLVVQLRPSHHALDLDIAWAASEAYTWLAPNTTAVSIHLPGGLLMYEMNKLEGMPVSRLQFRDRSVGNRTQKQQEFLIISFARVIAKSWPKATSPKRRDSVIASKLSLGDEQSLLSQCTGKVGSCIAHKLERLTEKLPDKWLREKAQSTRDRLHMVEQWPIVLTHGDLIPSNILVDEETWQITGLVDWAEAEFLPFGICLYGLDHLLGFLESCSSEPCGPTFVYYDNALQLRELFWTHIFKLVPELETREEEVHLMRDVGVFLWHGYAWDEGAIDRVVDEVNDVEELVKLRALLSV